MICGMVGVVVADWPLRAVAKQKAQRKSVGRKVHLECDDGDANSKEPPIAARDVLRFLGWLGLLRHRRGATTFLDLDDEILEIRRADARDARRLRQRRGSNCGEFLPRLE